MALTSLMNTVLSSRNWRKKNFLCYANKL